MLELDLQIHKEKFKLEDAICEAFPNPIIFYCWHTEDVRNFFTTFVVMDFQKKEMTYYSCFSPKNQKKTDAYHRESWLQTALTHCPHSTLRIKGTNSFYNFIENGRFLFFVDPEAKKIKVFTGEDLNCEEAEDILSFGSTFYWIEEDPDHFYFCAHTDRSGEGIMIHYYKTDAQLKNIEKIFSHPEKKGKCPHTTKSHHHYLFNSNFENIDFKLKKDGKIIRKKELLNRTYRHLYQKYCEAIGKDFAEEAYQKSFTIGENQMYELDPDFDLYIKSFFGDCNFKELCDQIPECQFELAPGKITMLDLETLDFQAIDTTFAAPAHFEIDEKEDCIYTSSHNFCTFESRFFFGPAGIDKYQLTDGKLIHKGCFSDPRGYRFTSHRFFRFEDKGYVCTIGKPNRLFIIDAQTMELDHFTDIGPDFLSDIPEEKVADALNHFRQKQMEYVALEVSENGEFICLIGTFSTVFYSMREKKVVAELPFLDESIRSHHPALQDCYGKSIHCQYF